MRSKSLLQIRPATAQDDARIGELLVESFLTAYARKLPEVVVTDSRKRDLRDVATKRAKAAVLVAELPEVGIVGTVTLYPPGTEGSKAWGPGMCELRFLALDLTYSGQGYSRLLLDATLEVATRWKAQSICLHVRRGARGVARMYESYGYSRVPEGDTDLLPEIFLEAYLLKLPLTAETQSKA